MKFNTRAIWALVAAIGFMPSLASAIFVDLVPSGDQWIWVNTPDDPRLEDAISVRDDGAGDLRAGLVQFNVLAAGGFIGADLLGAELRLNLRSSETQVLQTANIVDLGLGTQAIDSVTWNGYQAEHVGNELEAGISLGFHNDTVGAPGGTVYSSFADASELALIADMVDGGTASGLLTISMFASGVTDHDWTDGPGQLDNNPSILRLEFAGVTPPCIVCDVDLADAVWLRDGEAIHNDGVIVTNNPDVVGGAPTVGLMEWDLSNITDNPNDLIGAELTFTVAGGSRTTDPGQIAGYIDTTSGTDLADIASAQDYASEYGGTEALFEGLGVVPDTTGALGDGETFTTTATTADLALIRSILNGSDQLTMAMFGSDFAAPDGVTGQYWGDGMGFGAAPRLTLTFRVPEPGTALLAGIGLVMAVVARRRMSA